MYIFSLALSTFFLAISLPIFLVFAIGSSVAAIWGLNLPWSTLIQISFQALAKHVLIAVPLFIFAGRTILDKVKFEKTGFNAYEIGTS